MNFPASGIIIQARTGSSRHPRKVVLPFHQGNSILDILLSRLRKALCNLPIIVATTCAEADKPIVELAQKHGVRTFKGSEDNVLDRILKAAQLNKLEKIIRICADNPFLNIEFLKILMHEHNGEDYVSFRFKDHTPVIRSHLGLFAEATTQSALARVLKQTNERIYKEHVTNFIYSHPQQFSIKWLQLPKYLDSRQDLRFTSDTPEDFHLYQKLYSEMSIQKSSDFAIRELVELVDQNEKFLATMQSAIKGNSK